MLPREESRPPPSSEDAADVSLSHNYKHDAASLSALLPPPPTPPPPSARLAFVTPPHIPGLIYSFNNTESYANSHSPARWKFMKVVSPRRTTKNRIRPCSGKILKALLFPWLTGTRELKEHLGRRPPPSPRLCDNVCENELVSPSRQNSSLLLSAAFLIPLAAGNKKCHCHGLTRAWSRKWIFH